ncbi:MAG TPA: NUMOD4 domain-containing protein [Methanofastidiosum sp.]|nr:NUMOD4 domain-containing protein [Methanofastidiosum sp.]
MEETWKDIPSYEGMYQASSLGRIKSLERISLCAMPNGGIAHRRIKEKILKPYVIKSGYQVVSLSKEGKIKDFLVHRLIAQTFISNPNNKIWINHKNGIKKDNMINNLEWCNPSENIIHAYNNHLMKKGSEHKDAKVVLMIKDNKIIKEFGSLHLAAEFVNVHNASISSACIHQHKCAGYNWRYK